MRRGEGLYHEANVETTLLRQELGGQRPGLIICADVFYNREQHAALVATIVALARPRPEDSGEAAYAAATPPWRCR